MTARRTWQLRESQAARLLGAERQPYSGSAGREDVTRSDSTHPGLFIETKYRASWSVWSLWRAMAKLARKEKKTPVLALYEKGRHGALWVVHQSDLEEFVAELNRSGMFRAVISGPEL